MKLRTNVFPDKLWKDTTLYIIIIISIIIIIINIIINNNDNIITQTAICYWISNI